MDPPGSTWQNRVAGRVALAVGGYRPYAKFGKLRQPVFVAVCEQDATTPPGPAVKAAEKSPNAELVRYPIGHFEIYVDPQFETTVDRPDRLPGAQPGGRRGAGARRRAAPRPSPAASRATFSASRSSLPRAMISLKLRTRKMKNSAAKPTPKANAPIAICWPTE